ncbi:MAG TPA: bifunctional hydroxymethylpyrimidine kinase/phosphomethylpyrimidine kinase [Deltaproteobacteria bacterium]|nr:bifunctional hydroxymethylpyrimidine kinase/phosphomethylpyrimidine kinase [Deltaproteobacteria bacterium]
MRRGAAEGTPTVLAAGGSDPSCGAGIQADMAALDGFGVRALTVVTALTAQNSTRLTAVEPVPAALIEAQFEALLEEFHVDAVKIGMLARADAAAAVRRIIESKGLERVVLDPVFRSTSGGPLAEPEAVEETVRIFPLTALVTPNLDEAARLARMEVGTVEEMEEAGRRIMRLGAPAVLVKGGHLGDGDPVDVLCRAGGTVRFEGRRVKGSMRGTGCRLASAVAAGLARGRSLEEAVADAKAYVEALIAGVQRAGKP